MDLSVFGSTSPQDFMDTETIQVDNENMDEEEDIDDDDEFEEEEDDAITDLNQTNTYFRSLNETEDKIVRLMDLCRDLIGLIQSQDENEVTEEYEKLIQQYLEDIKDIKTNIAKHIHQVSKLPQMNFETNDYADRKRYELEVLKAKHIPCHISSLNQLIAEESRI
jgi:hypothetical protein